MSLYNRDGSSPSGFTNSTFCVTNDTNCLGATQANTNFNYFTVKVISLIDLFSKSTDVSSLYALLWYNPWVLFAWF